MSPLENSVSFLTGGAVVIDVIILACLIGFFVYASRAEEQAYLDEKEE